LSKTIQQADRLAELGLAVDAERARAMSELVDRHQICWEVWPEQTVVDGQLRTVGFQIELHGRHHHPKHRLTPGCDGCMAVYAALRRLGEFVLPKKGRASEYDIQCFDGRLHYEPGTTDGNVVVTIRLTHGSGYSRPVDACELTCLSEIQERLDALGARCVKRGPVAARSRRTT
jgi:hypothetical protein